jgi:DNA repair photolyase
MRWQSQTLASEATDALPGMARFDGLVRSVQTPEFSGVTFHEVRARSVLNRVPDASAVPFRWTVNPWRGCTHACVYCFARGTHQWLELDTGRDFDTQVVVKTNAAEVLARELARPSWQREHVALGTNTDPYQRAEGRYRLMPGIIGALAGAATPFSVLTKGPMLRRDLPLLVEAAQAVTVGVGVSVAILDTGLHASLEPGTADPRARLDLVRAVADAGLGCSVMVAPVLPWLTDSVEHLDALLGRIAAAGASGATVLPLHLRPGSREWTFGWLAREHPDLVGRYQALYAKGAYVPAWYARRLTERVRPLLHAHGLDRARLRTDRDLVTDADPTGRAAPEPVPLFG